MRHLAAIVEMRRRRGGLQREYAGEDLVSRSRQAPTKPGIPPPASGSSQIVQRKSKYIRACSRTPSTRARPRSVSERNLPQNTRLIEDSDDNGIWIATVRSARRGIGVPFGQCPAFGRISGDNHMPRIRQLVLGQ